ncbi:MAG: hypothetical protein A2901_01150 [Elusimicrobia bacterium RIFCSPLOWO2_01_FULL_54_10]|nr:MAG: hypothetical protein A2901_01150 [Elusimicrobia bacterium RIFCSPLOWO2_01_FULL_54_10]
MKNHTLLQRFLYRLSQVISQILFRTLGLLIVHGRENIPKKGGYLLASNHLSNMDPPLVGSSLWRPIYYFAKEELFRIPVLGWWIAQINAFPVKRYEHDIGAFKKARAVLAAGEGLLMFPEGRRSKTGELGKAKPGAGMLAIKAGVPVIPVHITNSHKFLKFSRLRLDFGAPLWPSDEILRQENYEEFSAQIMAAIAALKSKMYNEPSSKK